MADQHTQPLHGIASPEDLAGLSGMDTLRAMVAGRLPAPPIARLMHFRLSEVEEGRAVFEGDPVEDLLNPLGTIHGGWALTLIDSACGCAFHSTLEAGLSYTTVETKVNFARMLLPGSGTVRCEGNVLTRGRRIGTTEARVIDAAGRVIAHGTSTLLVLRPGD